MFAYVSSSDVSVSKDYRMIGLTLETETSMNGITISNPVEISRGKRKLESDDIKLNNEKRRLDYGDDFGTILKIENCDMVQEVSRYETITDYIQLIDTPIKDEVHMYTEPATPSPSSLSSGYHSVPDVRQDSDDSNLSWLLNFKVSSLFDPEDPVREDTKEGRNADPQSARTSHAKPPYTYTELIVQALTEHGELTVSGIYSWISKRFPFYQTHDDRWKNSVRHNLSINPHFRKGVKSKRGSGHLWTLSNECALPPDSWKRTRCRNIGSSFVDTDMDEIVEVAAATASITDKDSNDPDMSLHRTAEEILSGVKKKVEVQYLTHEPATNGFLNPVSKEEFVEESGLVTNDCSSVNLMNELNADIIIPETLFSEDLNFQCYPQI